MFTKFNTNNESFIGMHYHLKNKGVENNQFFLRLDDKSLIGVNPHDRNLSDEIKERIIIECKNNIWYFLREVVLIPTREDNQSYHLDSGNLAQTYGYLNNWNMIIERPRNNRASISTVCLHVHDVIFNKRQLGDNVIAYLNKTEEDSELNKGKFHMIYNALPEYIIDYNPTEFTPITIDIDNLIFGHYTQIQQSLKIWIDNFAFIPNLKEIMQSNENIFRKQALNAKDLREPYGIIATTSAADITTSESAKYAYDFIKTCKSFKDEMYDYDNPYEYTDKDFIHMKFTYSQLGRTKKWYDAHCDMLNNQYHAIATELDLNWNPWHY